MRISTLAVSEVDAIAPLVSACGFHVDPARELERSYAHFWVARAQADSPTPDAFLLAWQAADELDVIALGTAVPARRKGLARALIGEMLKCGRTRGVRRVLLEVRASNAAAIQLYRSFGFAVGRTREDYYSNPTEDGVEMSLEIDRANTELPTSYDQRCSEACR